MLTGLHGNTICENVPQHYVIPTLFVLLNVKVGGTCNDHYALKGLRSDTDLVSCAQQVCVTLRLSAGSINVSSWLALDNKTQC